MNTMWISFILNVLFACTTTVLSGTHPDGVSKTSREQDALGNYKFSYSVSNPEGEHFREEGTDSLGRVVGSYGINHKDGSLRVVDYVADKDGFRAAVRSNEPGVISSESADASILKLQPDLSLAVAATSIESSGSAFGSRLKANIPRVTYVTPEDKSSQNERIDNSARESRLRSYDDYRPRNPVAYYPSGTLDTARPLSSPALTSSDIPGRARLQRPSDESKPLDVYLPPIDPQTAVRRPPYVAPRERTSNRSPYTTTSQRPYIPPYGGFDDDDPAPVERRPGISMSTIHGGLGRDDFESPQISTPGYGAGRYPSDDGSYISREYINPYFPPRSNFPPISRLPGGILSSPPRSVPGTMFGPPSYDTGLKPNFVLRAVPIPNGIQAVRIDPETGHVYERLNYPLFLRDGQTVYDKNILLHNDDVSDDSVARNRNPGYFDMTFRRRPPFRAIRNPSFDFDEEFENVTRFNRTLDPLTMSIPTSRDLEWIHRQLSQVEGFDRARFPPSPSVFRNTEFRDNEYPSFNDFDDAADENTRSEDIPQSRNRNSGRSGGSFSRDPRLIERLTPEDTKEIMSKSGSLTVEAKPAETDPKPVVVAKDS